MLDEGEPDEENGPKGKAEVPPPLDPDPVPLGPRWPSIPEAPLLGLVAPVPDVMC